MRQTQQRRRAQFLLHNVLIGIHTAPYT